MDPALLVGKTVSSASEASSSKKPISTDIFTRIARTFGASTNDAASSTKATTTKASSTNAQLPTPSSSIPSSPAALKDAITTPLSGRSRSQSLPPSRDRSPARTSTTTTPTSPGFGAELRRTESASSVASSIKRKLALSGVGVGDFLKKLGKDLASLGGSKDEAAGGSSKTSNENVEDGKGKKKQRRRSLESALGLDEQQQQQARSPTGFGHGKLLSMVAEGEEEDVSSVSSHDNDKAAFPLPGQSSSTSPGVGYNINPYAPENQHGGAPDPAYLAHRLQCLIDALPSPAPLPPTSPPPSAPPTKTIPLPPEDAPSPSPDGRKDRDRRRRRGLPLPGVLPTPKRDKEGKPIPPPGAVPKLPEEDREVLEFLKSATVMNGGKREEVERGEGGRVAVWDVLAGMVHEAPAMPNPTPPPNEDGKAGDGGRRGGGEGAFSDSGSVMLYSPLIPGKQDIVELAEVTPVWYEEELLDDDDGAAAGVQAQEAKKAGDEAVIPVGGWVKTMWPLGGWFGASQEVDTKTQAQQQQPTPEIVLSPPTATSSRLPSSPTPVTSPLSPRRRRIDLPPGHTPYTYPSPLPGSPFLLSTELPRSPYVPAGELPRSPYVSSPLSLPSSLPPTTQNDESTTYVPPKRYRIVAAQAWVPSTTQVSYEVMWWGYRIYLPPPAMLILSDKSIEAQKRAALITTALTWFFNNIPVDVLPLPLQPTVLLLQRLAPYLGYVGTFIAWSWNMVKSYDLGYGVILSATWLLPIALVPGTWFEHSFPKSPSSPEPLPLPPADSTPAPTTPASPPPTQPEPTTPPTDSVPGSPAPPYTEPGTPSAPGNEVPADRGGGEEEPHAPVEGEHEPPTDENGRREREETVPWSPKVGISPKIGRGAGTRELQAGISTHGTPGSPSGAMRGGWVDKRGWGRFHQVLRGSSPNSREAKKAVGVGAHSFVVSPSTPSQSLPPSTSTTSSPAQGGNKTLWDEVQSPSTQSESVPSSPWATPAQSPMQRAAAVVPGSPLMHELLQSTRVGTVPLPSSD